MTSTRTTLLEAAARVLARDGAAQLTLDAVAREAGVSKGGLLYHFPSKDALVQGVLEAFVGQIERGLAAREAADECARGRFARANFELTLAGDPQPAASSALLAALALRPELLEPVRAHYAGWRARAEADGLEPGLGTLLTLAADGLWLSELLGLGAPTGKRREQLRALVARLSGGAA